MPDTFRNLATRSGDGITVTLDWNPRSAWDVDCEPISVHVKSDAQDFTLYPHPSNALDCYHHPFAYASRVLSSGREDYAPMVKPDADGYSGFQR